MHGITQLPTRVDSVALVGGENVVLVKYTEEFDEEILSKFLSVSSKFVRGFVVSPQSLSENTSLGDDASTQTEFNHQGDPTSWSSPCQS